MASLAKARTMTSSIAFRHLPHPRPTAPASRDAALTDPGFGKIFSDHMVSIEFTRGRGWHSATLGPREPIALDPACAVLHYAQEIFEGMKAYRLDDGAMALFRPTENAKRFNVSALRMAMPEFPEALFVESVKALVRVDADWFPGVEGGSIYLRPFMFASEARLGVRPSREYLFLVIASPVGGYFKADAKALSLWVSDDYVRAAPGGTGAAKTGGNYAASLIAQQQSIDMGCDQIVFLDAVERRWVEELGGMNLFFVFDDGSIQTPPLGGTILPGITRDAVITLARDDGLTVREQPYAIDQWRADAQSGRLTESFACGTAAVVTPVGTVAGAEGGPAAGGFTIGSGGPGQVTMKLRQRLLDIQRGHAPDPHDWVERIDN